MSSIGTFPFGMPVQQLIQADRSPKKVFVLGVYASAVHARWIGTTGRTIINALAVASEPYIFWRGENPESLIKRITIPDELGKLVPARRDLNGPSGLALDQLILNPLGFDRADAWLCDLVPYSCMNPSQKNAIDRAYLPVARLHGLPQPSVPSLPNPLIDEFRRNQILAEISDSDAKILILLGDLPIKWFLSFFDKRWTKLLDFGNDEQSYGHLHNLQLGNRTIQVLPVAHPRQIARLGQSSIFWHDLHAAWMEKAAVEVAASFS